MKIDDEKLERMLKNEENPSFDPAFSFREPPKEAETKKRGGRVALLTALLLLLSVSLPAVLFVMNRKKTALPAPEGSGVLSEYTAPDETSAICETTAVTSADTTAADTGTEPYPLPAVLSDRITVYTLTSLSKMSGNPQEIKGENVGRYVDGIDEAEINRITGGRYVNFTSATEVAGHAGHSCLIYDAVEDKVFCGTCVLAGISGRIPTGPHGEIIIDNSSTTEKILFSVWDAEKRFFSGRFIYDIRSDSLKEIPVQEGAKNDRDVMAVSSDFRYIAAHSNRGTDFSLDDVYLIDTLTGDVKKISGDYPTFVFSRFTPDGRYLLNALKYYGSTEDFDSVYCRFIVTGIAGGRTTECIGKLLRYGEGRILTRDGDSVHHLYDLESGTEIAVPEGTLYWDYAGGSLCRGDACRNQIDRIDSTVSAWCVSADGNTVLTYTQGSGSILLRGLDGSEGEITLDREFVLTTEKLSDTHNLYFTLQEEDGVALLLYSSVKKPDKPASPGTGTAQPPTNDIALSSFLEYETPSSISEAVTKLTDRYPYNDFGFVAASGDGYICVYAETGEARDKKYVFVEDYRDGTFSVYAEYIYHGFVALRSRGPGYYHRFPLSSTRAETLAFINENRMPKEAADIDYAIFYSDGQYSREKMYDYVFSPEYSGNISSFFARLGNYGIKVYSDEYKKLLRDFLSELAGCERVPVNYASIYPMSEHGEIRTDTELRLRAVSDKDGNHYVLVSFEDLYRVPEYVYSDLLSLAVSGYANTGYCYSRTSVSITSAHIGGDYECDYFLSAGELKAELESGDPSPEVFIKGRDRLLALTYNEEKNEGHVQLLISLKGDSGSRGFVYLQFSAVAGEDHNPVPDKITRAELFDANLRYCCDLLREGYSGIASEARLTFPEYRYLTWDLSNPKLR